MNTTEIGIFDAKTQLSKLIEQVQKTGESIVITKHGKPAATLSPAAAGLKPRVRGCGAGPGYFMAPDFDAPLEDFEEYMYSEAELAERHGLRVAETPAR